MLTVANFNMHCGIDGWGRPFDALGACASLDADVLMLEETWTADEAGPGNGQAEQFAAALGYDCFACPLGEGRRIQPQPQANDAWMPRPAMAPGNLSLYFHSQRPVRQHIQRMPRYQAAEPGTLGSAVLIRSGLDVQRSRTLHLPQLQRDQIRRAVVLVDLIVDGVPLSVAGTHMSHMHVGSFRHWMQLRHLMAAEAQANAVLAGDMNLWGPPVRAFMSGWHRAVKGKSWPTARPHSQIDHILVRGDIVIASGEVLPDAGSDHRPIRARLTLS